MVVTFKNLLRNQLTYARDTWYVALGTKVNKCSEINEYINIFAIYEGESISNQHIPFSMDRDGQHFHALFQYMFYL